MNSFSLSFTSFGSDGTGTGCDEGAANTGWYTGGVGAAICVMGATGGGYQFCKIRHLHEGLRSILSSDHG